MTALRQASTADVTEHNNNLTKEHRLHFIAISIFAKKKKTEAKTKINRLLQMLLLFCSVKEREIYFIHIKRNVFSYDSKSIHRN